MIVVIVIMIFILSYNIRVNEVTKPVIIVSKEDYNIIYVKGIYDNEEFKITISDQNVWNLIIQDQSYLVTYNQKLFNKKNYLEQISILQNR